MKVQAEEIKAASATTKKEKLAGFEAVKAAKDKVEFDEKVKIEQKKLASEEDEESEVNDKVEKDNEKVLKKAVEEKKEET